MGFGDIAYNELASAKLLFEQNRASLDQETISNIENSIRQAEEQIALRNYGSAIQGSKSIVSAMSEAMGKRGETDSKILAIAVLVIGSLIIIAFNYKEAILSRIGMKKEVPHYRKLRKGSEL